MRAHISLRRGFDRLGITLGCNSPAVAATLLCGRLGGRSYANVRAILHKMEKIHFYFRDRQLAPSPRVAGACWVREGEVFVERLQFIYDYYTAHTLLRSVYHTPEPNRPRTLVACAH